MIHSPNALETRTVAFSKDIIAFCQSVKVTSITRSMLEQLIRSGTSIGANYAEANNAASKADFRNKIFIAKKEAAETKYWLELLAEVHDDTEACRNLWRECHFILMTLQKIIGTLNKSKTDNGERPVNGKR